MAVALALACGTFAAPARAIVGGVPVDEATVPWFASLPGCGGVMVAPDRVLTAGHCVVGTTYWDMQEIRVAGTLRRGVRFSMHPGWQRSNGANVLEDIAIIKLDAPVIGVPLVALGGRIPARLTVIGRGATLGITARTQLPLRELRGAELRPVGDRECGRAYRHRRGDAGERFYPAQMICATDVDGRRPFSSTCWGDSGGPLYSGPNHAPVVHGIVSWGSQRCGLDLLPSVYASVRRARAFIRDRNPVWAPVADGPAVVSGIPRPGRKLTCAVRSWSVEPRKVDVAWERSVAVGPGVHAGEGRTYTVKRRDAGRSITCSITASNAGGRISVADAPESTVDVPDA